MVKVVTNVLEGGSLTSHQSKSEIRIAKNGVGIMRKMVKKRYAWILAALLFAALLLAVPPVRAEQQGRR